MWFFTVKGIKMCLFTFLFTDKGLKICLLLEVQVKGTLSLPFTNFYCCSITHNIKHISWYGIFFLRHILLGDAAAEDDVPEGLPEVGVEDGVDDRIEGGVEVAQPGDEHVHLHIWFCIWCCICICISNFLFVFVFVVWNFKLDVYPASGEFGEISQNLV